MAPSLLFGLALAAAPSSTELTVYNQGFALVKEERELNLRTGDQEVAVEDVAAMIESNSVGILSLSKPGSFSVLEQNYKYDLISPIAILNKVVGKKITFRRILPNGVKETVTGTLLSSPTAIVSQGGGESSYTYNGLVFKADDGRIILNPTGEIEVDSIPEGLISKPTLMWQLNSREAGTNKIQLSYLTQGMSWTADYVLNLSRDGKLGALKGWVTLNNVSGATYKNAKLKLLAGEVQRIQNMASGGFGGRGGGAPAADAMKMMDEESFAEYHLYTMTRPTTVADRETKQVSLLEAFDIPVRKKLVVDAMRMYRGWRPNEGAVGTGPISPLFLVEFTNDEASKLGMPLPEGRVKVLQPDSSGSLQMIGEDQIRHTPKNEKLSLAVGRSFDVVAERKRTNFKWLNGNSSEGAVETYEIEVRNRKETAETVHVFERPYWEWKVTEKNMEYTKLDSNTIDFEVVLGPNETKKVVYTVEYRW
jgi:hypothetical protein